MGFLWTSEDEFYEDDFPWRDIDNKEISLKIIP